MYAAEVCQQAAIRQRQWAAAEVCAAQHQLGSTAAADPARAAALTAEAEAFAAAQEELTEELICSIEERRMERCAREAELDAVDRWDGGHAMGRALLDGEVELE